ncbi:MAG TPA: TlpA disulfide reductase family protein [Kiritimatiellia bacterium]
MNRTQTLVAIFFASVALATAADYAADHNALLSRLQSMGHGSYTEAEWQDVFTQIEDIAARADQAGDAGEVIEINIVKAMVYSDMQRDYSAALAVLQDIRTRYEASGAAAMRKVFIKQAEVFGKLGDESSVRQVIAEFKASRYYDPETYPFAGGKGPGVPLELVRPTATGSDSLSVTAMEVARTRSQFAEGGYFPTFNVIDRAGGVHELADYRGKVLLLDFWVRDWTPWKRDLPNQVSAYSRYHKSGLEILGFCLERDPADLDAYLSSNKLTWPQVAGDTAVPARLGIFGEASNYLLDQNGMIIGRNLRGADLVEAIKTALSPGDL